MEQLKRLKAFIESYQLELTRALELDLKRSVQESRIAEIIPILAELDVAIRSVDKWRKESKVRANVLVWPASAKIRSRRFGEVLIIGAFNYPVLLLIGPLIHALAAGNKVVLKTSEMCPCVAQVIAEHLGEFVEGVQVVQGGADVTQRILNQRKFDLVFFTGSERVGKIIASIAARTLTPVKLELGGKCPGIVDWNVDLKVAAKRMAWSKWVNCGQTCTAVDYAMVHEKVYQEFIEELKSAFKEFAVYQDPKFCEDYARIISPLQVDRMKKLVEQSNAEFAFGGEFDSPNRYASPTILTNVKATASVRKIY
jgi:aldehyde dehydrogenase (NAD+)